MAVVQAQDTFVAEMEDGSTRFVAKGDVLPASHELVRRDRAGSGTLFRDLDLGEEEGARAQEKSRAQAVKGTTAGGPPKEAAATTPKPRAEVPKPASRGTGGRA